jgi:Rrf2 family protein
VQIPAKADYALRALLELAHLGQPATADVLAKAQGLPIKFLAAILNDLRHAGLIASRRGPGNGGYVLIRPAADITVAEVLRSVGGTLVEVRGGPPELILYGGAAQHLQDVWFAARATLENVLSSITLADIVRGELPETAAGPAPHTLDGTGRSKP